MDNEANAIEDINRARLQSKEREFSLNPTSSNVVNPIKDISFQENNPDTFTNIIDGKNNDNSRGIVEELVVRNFNHGNLEIVGASKPDVWEDSDSIFFPGFLENKQENQNQNQKETNDNSPHDENRSTSSIRTKILSKSGFSEYFVKSTLKGKGVIFRGPPRDGQTDARAVIPEPNSPKDESVNLREWLKMGKNKVDKSKSLYIFKQILDLVDSSHSQGEALQALRPSFFKLLPSNQVLYMKELTETKGDDVLLSNQFLKRRKHGENLNSFGMWQQFPNRSGSNHGQTQTQTQTQPGLTSFGGDLLEEQWYVGPEDVKERPCMMSSNVYSLGVLLFEILGSFVTSREHAVAMMNLRQRILPPRFLSENPKEAGFCLWLLHPEASARPTTRDILKSKLISEIEETSTDDLLSSIAQEDTESELLLHFLTSLKDQKQKQAANLIKDINYLKSDIKEVESRQSIQENNKQPINESRLKANLIHLESAYFSIRSSIKNDPMDTIDQENNKPLDRLGMFFNGLCKYARDEDYFATAGVSKKIKVYDFHLLLDDSVDIHYPAIEMVNKSKVSCISWNNYIKNYLASTDYDGSVKIWDAGTGQTVSHHIEHEKRAWSVDFSRVDPTKLASGSDDCYVKLWSINEKKSLSTIRNIANVCCVQFSPFSSHLVCFGSADYRTYCYDLRNITTPLCILGGHDRAVSYVKFLDGETVISASTDNTLKLWDLKKTKFGCLSSDACIMTFKGHTNEKNFVGLSVADGYIACGSETNEVFAYYRSLPMPITAHKFGSIDPVSGKETDHANNQFVSSVCWRQKSDMVIAANSSGCLKLLQMV
ncbi:unnamed protein product [Lactuca virosa]|uniref:Protein kinase domain-containing protein n=1 Tax=Lactuca virosa TaxID=75947 RepID=A0AAU9PT44_9ASTR|nr:unnamed protein product [Lactuca virosa]